MLSTIGSVASQGGGGKKIIHFDFNDASISYDKASGTNWIMAPTAEWWTSVAGKFGNAWKMENFKGGSGMIYKDGAMAEALGKDFTIDMWINCSTLNQTGFFFNCGLLWLYLSNRDLYVQSEGSYSAFTTLPTATWGYLKVAVSSTKISVLYNGVLKLEKVLSAPLDTTGLVKLLEHDTITLDEFRVRVGVCDLSTEVPTAPFE